MYSSIYQNSFIVAILSFIILCILFYIFEIGYTFSITDGKIKKSFSIKYPLAAALIIWLIWYFYLYPPQEVKGGNKENVINTIFVNDKKNSDYNPKKDIYQQMIMETWK